MAGQSGGNRGIRSCTKELGGLPIAGVEQHFNSVPQPLVRSALLHLLWRQEFIVDLSRPLRPSTVLEASK